MRSGIRIPSYSLDERPFLIIWEMTQACDLACRHCRASAIPRHHPASLNTTEAKALLREVDRFGTPRPIFVFTGGDPFKRPDLFELLAYGRELGLVMAVSPSGTPLLTRENLRRVRESGAHAISLSIDGSNPHVHDTFRGVNGSFDLTTSGWQAARELGLKVQINTTVTKHNLTDLPHIFELVLLRGAMTWSVFFLVPVGRGKVSDEVTPDEYEAVFHFLYDCSKYLSIKTTEGHHYKRIVLQRIALERAGRHPEELLTLDPLYAQLCRELHRITARHNVAPRDRIRRVPMHINAGNGFVFISHKGEIFPSGFMPQLAGSVRSSSLVETYRTSPVMTALRNPDLLEGRCGRCEFRHVCGGSRSRAYAMTGNPFAEEPFCTYEPGSFPLSSAS